MKAIYRHIFRASLLTILLLQAASCAKINDSNAPGKADKGLVLSVTARGTSTKATQPAAVEENGNTELNENKIRRIDAFIIDEDGAVKYYQKFDELDEQTEFTGRLNTKAANFDNSKKYSIYAVVNYAGTEELEDVETLAALKQIDITLAEDFDPNSIMDEFVMDGHLDNLSMAEDDQTFEVHVKRAAAKIRIHVSFTENVTSGVSEEHPYEAKMISYVDNANLLAEGTKVTVDDMNRLSQADYAEDKGGKENCSYTVAGETVESDFIFYSYPNDWNADNGNQSYISLKVPLQETTEGGETIIVDYYYKIPVNWRLPDDNDKIDHSDPSYLYRLDRNHIYEVEVMVDAAGSTEPDIPKELVWTYHILDWAEADRLVDIHVYDIQWLWVLDEVLYMENFDTITTDFDSSLMGNDAQMVVTIDWVKRSGTNIYWPNSQTGPGDKTGMSVTLDPVTKGKVHIVSPVPDNYTSKEFQITITNTKANPAISQTIHVYQDPPLALNLKSNARSASAGSGQNNSTIYDFQVLLSTLQNLPPDAKDGNEYELNENRSGLSPSTHNPTNLSDRQARAQTAVDFLRNEARIGYPLTEKTTYGSVSSTIYNNTQNVNLTGVDVYTTVETEENSKMISPRFILASQAGANNITNYDSAKKNCAGYYEEEKLTDGTIIRYDSGTWRLPTYAELLLIDLMQNLTKSSVKRILEGYGYVYTQWDGTNHILNFMDGRVSSQATRCVRDIK
ncbi:MAG: hypothetical protein HUJ89_07185 [Bacteroidales bacterium]|nr:hypothetical protein [Bacteroidales bacterium]